MDQQTIILVVMLIILASLLALYFYLRTKSPKKKPVNKYLYWTPRILGILFIILLSTLALDAFSEGYSFWMAIGAFLIHLTPNFMLLLVLLIAWKREEIGGSIFIVLGIIFIILTSTRETFPGNLIVAGPFILVGILFLLNKLTIPSAK